MRPTILLIGGGHANLWVASRAAPLLARGARMVLVDPGRFWYSGMATGMLGGRYAPADGQLDLRALAAAAGGGYVQATVLRIDPGARRVHLADGHELAYDWLSLNVGSGVAIDAISGARDDPTVFPVKPISQLWRLRQQLEARFAAGKPLRVVVVGGGPTGVEIAASIAGLAVRRGSSIDVAVVTRAAGLLPRAPTGARRWIHRKIAALGITIQSGIAVVARQGPHLVTDDGRLIPANLVVLATGLDANPLVHTMGLPVAGRHGLVINHHLQSIGDERILAGGDVATLEGIDLPKLGVFGVRQAPYIHANLLACLDGTRLATYIPQKRQLAILNLGDGTALATWGRLWWQGRSGMWLKDRIDRHFLAAYRATFANLSR